MSSPRGVKRPTRKTYFVHGGPGPAEASAHAILNEFGGGADVAPDRERVALGAGGKATVERESWT